MYRSRIFFETLVTVGCSATMLVVVFVLAVSFFSSLARALRRVSPENRRMEPGQVWLNLIPVFNLVWCTVTVERVAESLRNEFRERGMHKRGENYGRGLGLTTLALLATGVLFYPAFVCYPVAFGYWIAYWVRVNRYSAQLKPGAYSPPPTDEGW